MNTHIDALAEATERLAGLTPAAIGVLDDADLQAFVAAAEQVGRHADRLRVAAAAELDDRCRPELGPAGLASKAGYSKGIYLLERLTRVSSAEASRRIRLGGALRAGTTLTGESLPSRFETLSAEMDAGAIDTEAAATIVRHLSQLERTATLENLEFAQQQLVELATREPSDLVGDLARLLRDRLDPDGVLPREEETRARRGIRLGRERNGVTPISGGLEPIVAALLKSAFSEANAPGSSPRFLSDVDRRDGTQTVNPESGGSVVTLRDIRSRDQRQHDVLAGLLKAGVRNNGLQNGQLRSTADVTAVIMLSDLEAGTGPAWLQGVDEPISASMAEMLACDSAFRRVVLGNDGEVLHLGRTRYPFSAAQRRAIAIRDDGCIWDYCTAPPEWCDIHHAIEYNQHGNNGTTDVDNGVMMCAEHHQFLHKSAWQLRMINGIPHVLAPLSIDPTQTWRESG
jgi:Domain of unknown function (DUF222)